MGVVYRARQLELDRDVALKVIAPELVEDPQSRKRFLSEARAAGAVEHPNVVPVHGVGVAEGRAYLVMRYVAGDDLRTLVRRDGPLSPDARGRGRAAARRRAWTRSTAAGYVHRDVKPQNVMVDAAGHVYLSDFGLAKQALATAGPTSSEHWVGTLDYVAPEQIRGEPVDARADVYALGGVVYFMLTGRVPFERDGRPRQAVGASRRPAAAAVGGAAGAAGRARRRRAAGDGQGPRAAAPVGGRPRPGRGRRGVGGRHRPYGAHGRARRRGGDDGRVAQPRSASARRPATRPVYAAAALTAAAAGAAFILLDGGDRPGGQSANRARAPQATATPRPETTAAAGSARSARRSHTSATAPATWRSSTGAPGWSAATRRGSPASTPSPGTAAHTSRSSARARPTSRATGTRSGSRAAGAAAVLGFSARSGSAIRYVDTPMPPTRVAAGRSGLWVVGREEPGGPAVLMRYDREGRSACRCGRGSTPTASRRSRSAAGTSGWRSSASSA